MRDVESRHGLSPVVGVVVVLIVTLILSAFLAAYVFRLPVKMRNVPSADFAVYDCPETLSSGKVFTIVEVNGNPLNPSDLEIILQNETSKRVYVLEWNGSAFSGSNLYIPVRGYVTTGKEMVCYQKAPVFSCRTKIKVSILYKPAGAFLFKTDLWVE